jgi:hypothetical protein
MKRGEVDQKKPVPPVSSLRGDIFRRRAIMNVSASPPALRKAWVDSVILPLIRAGQDIARRRRLLRQIKSAHLAMIPQAPHKIWVERGCARDIAVPIAQALS